MRLRRGLDALFTVNGVIATVLFVFLTAVVSLQILTRFVLHIPFIWSEEVARFLFFWVVLLGSALSVKNRRHFVIDVTGGRGGLGGPKARFLFDMFPNLCVLAFCLLLVVEGIRYTQVGLLRTATNSQINMAWVYLAIPVFAALSAIYSASNLVNDFRAFRQGRDATPRPPQSAE